MQSEEALELICPEYENLQQKIIGIMNLTTGRPERRVLAKKPSPEHRVIKAVTFRIDSTSKHGASIPACQLFSLRWRGQGEIFSYL